MASIKNFGEGIADFIIAERKKNGAFLSMEDFLSRIHDRNLNKKSMDALIKSGAMDNFGERGHFISNMDRLLEYNKDVAGSNGQDNLFAGFSKTGRAPLNLPPGTPVTADEKLLWEKELLGLYVSGHPLDKYKEKFAAKGDNNILKIKDKSKENETVVVGGLLTGIKEFLTKKGDKMLFIKIEDMSDSIEGVVFPKVLQEFQSILVADECIAIKARVSLRNGEKSLIVEKVKKL